MGARLEADSALGLYGAAVDLLRDIHVGRSPVAGSQSVSFTLTGTSAEERLFRFVRELVYRFDVDGFIAVAVDVAADRDGAAVSVSGQEFDPGRHRAERQVKAVTRHGFQYQAGPDGAWAEMIFDL